MVVLAGWKQGGVPAGGGAPADPAPTAAPCAPQTAERLEALVAAARAGEAGALGELLDAVRDYLLVVAVRRLPADVRPHLAPSDVVQDTACEAQRAFAAFRGARAGELLGWLRGILVHNVGDAVRRQRAHDRALDRRGSAPPAPLPVDESRARRSPAAIARPTEASAIRRDDALLVARVLAGLSDDAQLVVRMRYWEGLSFVEIGRRLGRTDNAVRKTWFRAVARLQDELRRDRH
ncbi:MAG: sigma-70 family RNA polymerase sigma factor [Planctomycetaceae bacterium]